MLAETVSTSPAPQTWITALTAIAGTLGAVLAKKRFGKSGSDRSRTSELSPRPSHLSPVVTQSQLQTGLDAMRDRVTAGYLAMAEKFDGHQKEILAAIGTQGTALEKRLDALEN